MSVESTFTGRTLRQMAEEIGDLDRYRFQYQPASAVAHGEWGTIEDYCLQRCANPLHLFHLLRLSSRHQWSRDSPKPFSATWRDGRVENWTSSNVRGSTHRMCRSTWTGVRLLAIIERRRRWNDGDSAVGATVGCVATFAARDHRVHPE